jgi:hypothetical protein
VAIRGGLAQRFRRYHGVGESGMRYYVSGRR